MTDKETQFILQSLLNQSIGKKDDSNIVNSILSMANANKNEPSTYVSKQNQQIIVLGMHRSGTSALAGKLINLSMIT